MPSSLSDGNNSAGGSSSGHNSDSGNQMRREVSALLSPSAFGGSMIRRREASGFRSEPELAAARAYLPSAFQVVLTPASHFFLRCTRFVF